MLPPLMEDGRPHWRSKFPEEVWPAFEDFRNFLALVWDHLGLPEPTPAQYELAHRLQYGVDSVEYADLEEDKRKALLTAPRRDIIRAFRSLGKSYTTSAYAIWRLMRNPRDEKVLVISATGSKAKEFVDQTRGILESMELVRWLLQGPRELGARRRDMADRFDVAAASVAQSFSVKAVGLTGQITGSRATLIIPDDIEIENNSLTEEARARIIRTIRADFGPIVKTEHGDGDIIFLGTPRTEESIYNVLVVEMGYNTFTIPVRFPKADKLPGYVLQRDETGERVNIIAYYLRKLHEQGELMPWDPTDTRFTHEELLKEEAAGRAHFALQFMLDTSLSDAERYPLKQHDLLVMATNPQKAPLTVQWGQHNDRKNVINDIPNVGFSGDYMMRPLFVDQEWRKYEGIILWVDPAGRGTDETAWAVVGQLSGMLYLLHLGAHSGDPATAMRHIAADAKRFDVNLIEVEPNFGQGMWIQAFQPILIKVWNANHEINDGKGAVRKSVKRAAEDRMSGCTVQESEWAKGQKETRIIDTLEPVLTAHRLVVNEELLRQDVEQTKRTENKYYSLLYQLTHITRERGSLKHDDRVEALAGAIAHFQQTVAMDTDEAAKAVLEEERDQMVEDFIDSFSDSPMQMRRRMRGKQRADGSRAEVFQWRG